MSPFHKVPPFFTSDWAWTHQEVPAGDEHEDGAAFGYEVAVPPVATIDAIGWSADVSARRIGAFRGISVISVLTMTVFLVAFLVARSLLRHFRIPLPRSSAFDLYRKRRSSSHVELLPRNSLSFAFQTSWSDGMAAEPVANIVYDFEEDERERNRTGLNCWSQQRHAELQIL